MNAEPLVRVENLVKTFQGRQTVNAVAGVSFQINKGETVGLVGESGCGKSTLGRCILRLTEPTSGKVFFDGEEITSVSSTRLRTLRRRMQMIFQDPYSSLNPRFTVEETLREPLRIHKITAKKADENARIDRLLDLCGLSKEARQKYPHEFSGGQRQRISIARALAVEPDFIVCDEPVSALDVSIQAQIINLLQDLQEELNLTYLFISHDLSLVEHVSKQVMVMYLGEIVENAPREMLYQSPKHRYTRLLLSSVPSARTR